MIERMVTASELRLRNYVSYNWYLSCDDMLDGEEPINVALVTIGVMHDIENGNKPMYKDKPLYGPIPITTEWLERFGFKRFKDELEGEVIYNLHEIINLEQINDNTYSFDYGGTVQTTLISSVHQLQNLIFSLTGRELELTK